MSSLVNENLCETMPSLGLFTLGRRALWDGLDTGNVSSVERKLDTHGGLIRDS